MADIEIMQSVSEVKKTKKVKKTSKRRESEVQITEVEQSSIDEKGYVSFEWNRQIKFISNPWEVSTWTNKIRFLWFLYWRLSFSKNLKN